MDVVNRWARQIAIWIVCASTWHVAADGQDQYTIPSAHEPAGHPVQAAVYTTTSAGVTDSPASLSEFPLLVSQQNDPKAAEKPSGSFSSPMVTVAFSLAIVLGLFAGLVWVTRRFNSGNVRPGGMPRDVLQNLGSAPLDARTRVTMLRCGGRIVVVAQTASGIHPLCEITDPREVHELTAACTGDSSPTFAETLQRVKQEPAQSSPPANSRQRLFASA